MTAAGVQSADSLRTVLDSVFAGREYRWVERPDPLGIVGKLFDAVTRWLTALHDGHPVAFRLLMVGMLLVVLAIFAHALLVFVRTIRAGSSPLGAMPEASGTRRDRSWYRQEADRLAAQGRFAEAIQADFLALVLVLDAWQLVRFHPSKTPAEYSREAQLASMAKEEFRALVLSLYGYAFARRPCGPAEFAEWRARAAPERYAPAR